MAVIHSPDSAFAKESVKWEAQYTPMGPPGRPFQHHQYPMMMHKAGRPAGGLGAPIITDTCIVTSDSEATAAEHKGFAETPLKAVEGWHASQTEIATLAAERNFHERRMSPAAQAEADAATAEAVDHLPSVPETPVRRRGRGRPPGKRSHHRQQAAVPPAVATWTPPADTEE